MIAQDTSEAECLAENRELRARLTEAEQELDAIRSGGVDALVVPVNGGKRLFTLKGADHAYRILIEAMQQGALIASAEGLILYANRSIASMLNAPLEKVIGSVISDWIAPQNQAFLNELLLVVAEVSSSEVVAEGGIEDREFCYAVSQACTFLN